MRFSDLTKVTSKIFRKTTYSPTYKTTSAVFYTYDDIRLKLYFEIAKSGEFAKLLKTGQAGNEDCLQAWEDIVKRQQKETGSNQYGAFFRLSKAYLIHINDHTTIRACLILVGLNNFFPDLEYVKFLKEKGYTINTTSPDDVVKSVTEGLHQCEKLLTKAISKQKELDSMLKQHSSGDESAGFEQVIANLNFALGFTVDDDLTLARYNEYQKILKARQKANEKQNGRNK